MDPAGVRRATGPTRAMRQAGAVAGQTVTARLTVTDQRRRPIRPIGVPGPAPVSVAAELTGQALGDRVPGGCPRRRDTGRESSGFDTECGTMSARVSPAAAVTCTRRSAALLSRAGRCLRTLPAAPRGRARTPGGLLGAVLPPISSGGDRRTRHGNGHARPATTIRSRRGRRDPVARAVRPGHPATADLGTGRAVRPRHQVLRNAADIQATTPAPVMVRITAQVASRGAVPNRMRPATASVLAGPRKQKTPLLISAQRLAPAGDRAPGR